MWRKLGRPMILVTTSISLLLEVSKRGHIIFSKVLSSTIR